MIIAKDLTVRRRHQLIIKNIDFCAYPSEITLIIGPNGSGKSTLLGALSGELAYQGLIETNGQNMARLKAPALAMMRGVLPQATSLSFPFLVHEVVALGLLGQRFSYDKKQAQFLPQQALEKVDLAGYGSRFYQELSGGEQARVQLARILTQIWQPVCQGQPCWLMLDEPVAALDIQHQLIVMDIARDFAALGGGVIAILHDLNLAAYYGDKIVLLDEGKVMMAGKANDVINDETLSATYRCDIKVNKLPPSTLPFILPQSRDNKKLGAENENGYSEFT